jgi:hypothetical protein
MSKERELLRRISSHSESRIPTHFIKEIQQLIAEPKQEPINFDLERMKLAVESPVSDVTVEGLTAKIKTNRVFYQEGYAQAELDLKREPLSDEEIAKLWGESYSGTTQMVRNFARAIEKAHDIGVDDEFI